MARQPELTPALLLSAYAAGLFPMSEGADDPDLFWVDPRFRGIFPLQAIRVSRSLAKVIKTDRFRVTADRDFEGVIAACAEASASRPSTWINATIRRLYRDLFEAGHVHTVEVWRDDRLVGGLYGVALGGAFFGESMFHRETDASKVALVHLAARLIQGGYTLLDTQFITPHLATLGAVEVPRKGYRKLLAEALTRKASFPRQADLSGRHVLECLSAAASRPALSCR